MHCHSAGIGSGTCSVWPNLSPASLRPDGPCVAAPMSLLRRRDRGEPRKSYTEIIGLPSWESPVAWLSPVPVSMGKEPEPWAFLPELASFSLNAGLIGGGSGIRTHDSVAAIHAFQACAFDRSATPPPHRFPRGSRSRGRAAYRSLPKGATKRARGGMQYHCRLGATTLR